MLEWRLRKGAYCGIVCTKCLTYKETQNNDDNARTRIAEEWSKQFQRNFRPEDINCDSCLAIGKRQFGYCRMCEIRKCSSGKHLPNCGYFTIDAKSATQVGDQLKPKVIIPMHWNLKWSFPEMASVDKFLRGKKNVTQMTTNEVEFKPGGLPPTTQIIVLKTVL